MILKEFKSIVDLVVSFPTEQSCREYLEKFRWKDGVVSPFDMSSKVYKCKNGRYKCKNTKRYFDVRTGTFLEDTKIPLLKWFIAIYYITGNKKGVSSCELSRHLNITQKSAWFMIKRIQKCLNFEDEILLEGVIQVDETFVGGKNKNRHYNKKVPKSHGRSHKDKTPVFGMISSNDMVLTKVVKDTSKKSLFPIIQEYVKEGSTIYSDEWDAYFSLKKDYNHEIVRHDLKQYVNGDVTTNKVEGYWTHLKKGIFGINHKVSRKHLQYYLDAQSFRYMTRKITNSQRFKLFLSNIEHRVKYKELISNT